MKHLDDNSADSIQRSAKRMQRARNKPGDSPLRGFGVFGIVGWSIAVPTVAGAFLGVWLNRVAPQNFSWTIALILGGVAIGGFIAWGMLSKESEDKQPQDMDKNSNEEDR